MDEEETVTRIKKDFQFLERDEGIMVVLLFGSAAKKESHSGSDFDICIPSEIILLIWQKLDVYGKNYDVYAFQELPLYMKINVIKNHEVIFSRDKYVLSEYMYLYWKRWDDQRHRNEMAKEEILGML